MIFPLFTTTATTTTTTAKKTPPRRYLFVRSYLPLPSHPSLTTCCVSGNIPPLVLSILILHLIHSRSPRATILLRVRQNLLNVKLHHVSKFNFAIGLEIRPCSCSLARCDLILILLFPFLQSPSVMYSLDVLPLISRVRSICVRQRRPCVSCE